MRYFFCVKLKKHIIKVVQKSVNLIIYYKIKEIRDFFYDNFCHFFALIPTEVIRFKSESIIKMDDFAFLRQIFGVM